MAIYDYGKNLLTYTGRTIGYGYGLVRMVFTEFIKLLLRIVYWIFKPIKRVIGPMWAVAKAEFRLSCHKTVHEGAPIPVDQDINYLKMEFGVLLFTWPLWFVKFHLKNFVKAHWKKALAFIIFISLLIALYIIHAKTP